MKHSKSENPFFLVLLTVLILSILSLLPTDWHILSWSPKKVNLLADVLQSGTDKTDFPVLLTQAPQDKNIAAGDSVLPHDTIALKTPVDTFHLENLYALAPFYQALHNTQVNGQKTRIAYFGDSMIEGDLITGDLRNKLQYEFGGEGVGFVPITSITAEFRSTIKHSFSSDWKAFNLVSKNIPSDNPLGISGHVFVPKIMHLPLPDSVEPPQPSWVQYTAAKMYKKLQNFNNIRLFYGPGNEQDKLVVTADKKQLTQPLNGIATINELILPTGGQSKKVKLAFDVFSKRNIYGLSFESDSGIVIDNFSFRGNSGLSLSKIKPNILASFNEYQHYNLVILHYGINVANYKVKNYGFYERGMNRIISRIQQAFPDAAILLVGMSDKSYNNAGEYVTDPSIPLLLQAQYNVAQKNEVAFWNLFEAMGGYNSMVTWVEAKPPLANKDYTHINYNGSKKVANLLYNHLMEGYKVFRNQQARL